MTPLEVVQGVARELDEAGVPSPRVDAEHLVAHVLGQSRTQLYSRGGELGSRSPMSWASGASAG